ncbi:MAG: helix-turn-helix domain-containing protein [Phycisphaeraceae bacterium]|nr:helix-turn-helix domain-containing protein [Phycisphaeraceae bacterium]
MPLAEPVRKAAHVALAREASDMDIIQDRRGVGPRELQTAAGGVAPQASAAPGDAEPLLMPSSRAHEMLGISSRQLCKMVAAKEVPHVRIGRRVLFSPRALEAWIDARTEGAR